MSITFTWNDPNSAEYTPEFTVIYRDTMPFEADALPEPLEEMPGSHISYVDETAVDGITYFYRVSFKLGIRENVSRLIEITAPTSPDVFESTLVDGMYPFSRVFTEGYYWDQAIVTTDFENAKWPQFVGRHGLTGYLFSMSWKSPESILLRFCAMIAIQKFRRDVWLTDELVLVADTSIIPNTGGNLTGRQTCVTGLPAGTKMTWREAFNMLGRLSASQDIAINVIDALLPDITGAFTSTRGVGSSAYTFGNALSALATFVMSLGAATAKPQLCRGVGQQLNRISGAKFSDPENPPQRGEYGDSFSFIRVIREVFRIYPEIMEQFRLTDQSEPLTYKTAADVVTDFLSTGTNSRLYADPLQSGLVSTSAINNNNGASLRERGLNGVIQLPPDSYAATGVTHNESHQLGSDPFGFFTTTTPNGKTFTTTAFNLLGAAKGLYGIGCIWNAVSSINSEYTDGLTDVDPLESLVALRYLPHLGLTDQSAFGTLLNVLGGVNMADHSSGAAICEGFPDLGLSTVGNETGMGTIRTNLMITEYMRSGTAFTIEMFYTDNTTANAIYDNQYNDLISIGGVNSGVRVGGVIRWDRTGVVLPQTFTSLTSTATAGPELAGRGYNVTNEAGFNAYGGSKFKNHVVLQYDPITVSFEVFVNGMMLKRWVPPVPTAAMGIPLTFFGRLVSAADQTTQRQYDTTTNGGRFSGELVLHEIVVTLAKRYNYANFIGKVPFARKRFTS